MTCLGLASMANGEIGEVCYHKGTGPDRTPRFELWLWFSFLIMIHGVLIISS